MGLAGLSLKTEFENEIENLRFSSRTGDQRLSEARSDERPANVSFALPCKGAVIATRPQTHYI